MKGIYSSLVGRIGQLEMELRDIRELQLILRNDIGNNYRGRK